MSCLTWIEGEWNKEGNALNKNMFETGNWEGNKKKKQSLKENGMVQIENKHRQTKSKPT